MRTGRGPAIRHDASSLANNGVLKTLREGKQCVASVAAFGGEQRAAPELGERRRDRGVNTERGGSVN